MQHRSDFFLVCSFVFFHGSLFGLKIHQTACIFQRQKAFSLETAVCHRSLSSDGDAAVNPEDVGFPLSLSGSSTCSWKKYIPMKSAKNAMRLM